MWFALLKNPLTKIIAEKTFGAISHKLAKDKIVREKELDAASQISIEQIKQQEHSLKDEWLCLFFTVLMALHFIPYTQDTMQRGWEILEYADPMFFYIILTIVGASFGVTTMNKMKKK
jgi:dethiobiotin synthetase|tara:strand:- start:209 stop:562 length:354 start_codon:yes stop_codon:yes gene_type:complete